MRLAVVLAVLALSAAPAMAQTVVCPYGQSCNGNPAVPFPVINPAQSLSNMLTGPMRQGQPAPQQPVYGYTPIPTPPPVMPAIRP